MPRIGGKRLTAVIVGLALALPLALAAPVLATALPPNLNGEVLFGFNATTLPAPGTFLSTAICSPTGNSTISVAVGSSGNASGPYPGTFNEYVTAVVTAGDPANQKTLGNAQPDLMAVGHTISLHADFTITSGTTTITGTDDLVTGLDGLCADFDAQLSYFGPQGIAHFSDVYFRALKSYVAAIHSPDGEFTDSGAGTVGLFDQTFKVPAAGINENSESFGDNFSSTSPVTPVVALNALSVTVAGTGSGSVSASPPALGSGDTLSASNYDTCGVHTDGTVACWGDNAYGQTVTPPGAFASVSTGDFHSCGVRPSGTVVCWGHPDFGQSTSPAGTFASVTAGRYHNCGIRTDGTLTCWGDNTYGQTNSPAGRFTSVNAGDLDTCAVRTDGTVACWGYNVSGQATPPAGLFSSISPGGSGSQVHICGVRTDGTLACSGFDVLGEATPPSGQFMSVSAGYYHTCGIRTDGSVACWGYNDMGQATPPAGSFTSVSAGYIHTCGIRTDGTVACWGLDGYPQATPPVGSFQKPVGGWYVTDTVVTLTASADANSTFVAWSGDCSGTGICVVTMDAARVVTATFDARPAQAPQTINFGPLADMTLGSPTFNLSASASSGLPVSYSASGPCSVSGSTVSTSGVGICTVTASQGGNASWAAATNVSQSFNVTYASTGTCAGGQGHTILQPINADGTSVFKQGSTVPAKFRVCDANGNSIGTAGTVTSFRLMQVVGGTVVANVDEAVLSTTPDTTFRWSGDQWIFNMATTSLSADRTYFYRITLNDGSHIDFHFGLR